jgi:hypothetical protein
MLREHGFSVQVFPSRFDKKLGFIFALNKRLVLWYNVINRLRKKYKIKWRF